MIPAFVLTLLHPVGMDGGEVRTVVCQRHSVSQSKECFNALAGSTVNWAEAWLFFTLAALVIVLVFLSLLKYYSVKRQL